MSSAALRLAPPEPERAMRFAELVAPELGATINRESPFEPMSREHAQPAGASVKLVDALDPYSSTGPISPAIDGSVGRRPSAAASPGGEALAPSDTKQPVRASPAQFNGETAGVAEASMLPLGDA